MAAKKKEKDGDLFFIRAETIEDLARLACKFDYNSDTLLRSRINGEDRLIALGEKVGERTVAYYVPAKGEGRLIQYTPASDENGEKAVLIDRAEQQNRYYISVMKADLGGIDAAKDLDKKSVKLIEVGGAMDLIGSAIRKNAKDEQLAQLYSFASEGKRFIGAFDLMDGLSNGKTIFYFSAFDEKEAVSFARYDYRENTLDFTNVIGEHAYMYAKVINLAEPFPFFKRQAKSKR